MLNMNLSVCFEKEGPCLVSVPVFENTKLPKLGCNWNAANFGKIKKKHFEKIVCPF